MPDLPARPSAAYLRKRAKRLARERSLGLAAAQRALANDYGFATWAQLIARVELLRATPATPDTPAPTLLDAIRRGDVAAVRALLDAGANPRTGDGRELPLHAAARRGPLELVTTLLAAGALEWQPDRRGRTALDIARRNRPRDRAAILALLDRATIADASFRAAVHAIHAGDAAGLARLLDAEPRLLHERIRGPEFYRTLARHQYFLEPKLIWFVAFNPAIALPMPANITQLAQIAIDRGAEPPDLDYTLELVMSSDAARGAGQQIPLMRTLLAAGAVATPAAIAVCAGHRMDEALRALVDGGQPMTAPIAAALGDVEQLRTFLARADASDVQAAFSFAVINGRTAAVRVALDAGADIDAPLAVHAHSTALHQAVANDDAGTIALLLERGACTDRRDTLWDGTPHDWALHLNLPAAAAALAAAR